MCSSDLRSGGVGDEKRTSVKPRESLGRFFRFEFVELPQRRRGADRNGNVLGKDRKLRQSPAVVWIIGLEQFQAVFQKAIDVALARVAPGFGSRPLGDCQPPSIGEPKPKILLLACCYQEVSRPGNRWRSRLRRVSHCRHNLYFVVRIASSRRTCWRPTWANLGSTHAEGRKKLPKNVDKQTSN